MNANFHEIYKFHPILFGIFPVLSLFSYNISLVLLTGLTELYILLIATAAFSLLLWGAINLIIKNKIKSGILASFSLIMFFLYGHFQFILSEIIDVEIHFLILWIGIFILGIFGILKLKRHFHNLSLILFAIAVSLVIFPLVEIANSQLTIYFSEEFIEKNKVQLKSESLKLLKPDIYYIILDAYPSEETLLEYRGYDNSEFLNYLESSGFYVASNSFSNYRNTFHSLASSLNI